MKLGRTQQIGAGVADLGHTGTPGVDLGQPGLPL